jgi:CheY-like chemotaxis protein
MAKERRRVLIVEDEGIVALDLRTRLKDLGYDVAAVAASGEDAVKRAIETRPDVILMDIVLQGEMDGIEAALRIRARIDVPIVYLTAYSDDGSKERARATGPLVFLTKPFEETELGQAIETALEGRSAESGPV